ncbi:MAG: transporter substrate-binding domain-containing protein [Oscillospiraceae bacterium]|nr:transporter substrate-binding domain-containing protein [Oscillospiraceae bacterium]
MKRIVCLVLALCLCLTLLCGCGSRFRYGVNDVQVLVEQDYSLAFRNNDPLYFYVTAALSVLAAEGRVDALATKWLGSACLNYAKQSDALERLQPPEPQDLIIGLDINSFPLAYVSNGEYWGLDVELAMAVCDKLGWTLKMQPIEKENVYIELSSGNIDVAWGGIALDPKEADSGIYTVYGPYVHNDIVVATRNGSAVWNKLRLSGRKMCMPSTPEAMAALETDPKLRKRLGQITRLAGGTTECFEYLYAGKCDVVLTDSTALDYFNCH